MEITNTSDQTHEEIKPQEAVIQSSPIGEINSSCPSATQQKVIKDAEPVTFCAVSSSKEENVNLKEKEQSPVLTNRMSRIETVRQDAKKLKTATLSRMGKMFKQHSQTPVVDKSSLNVDSSVTATKSVDNYNDEPIKRDKEKSNSLGRMLKFVDKDGSPRKLFQPRAGSLSRILRRHPSNENNDAKKSAEDNTPGIFSRMLNQLRGK